MNNDDLLPTDWLFQDFSGTSSAAAACKADDAPISDALARLFNAAFEAGGGRQGHHRPENDYR